MYTGVIMHMAIPIKPAHYLHNSGRSYASQLCGFSSTSTRAAIARLPLCLRFRCSLQASDQRRSGNYSPSFWNADYILSLNNHYKEESRHMKRAGELIVQVKMVMGKETDPVVQLELIDDLHKLALSHHFEKEIKEILFNISIYDHKIMVERDLYSTALAFRLLRQYGFKVPQEVFDCFKNDNGEFKRSLSSDTKGLLQLYEASFLLTEGEMTLELAREFATIFLQEKLNDKTIDDDDDADTNLISCVRHSLDIPIHWRIQRPNASWWIDAYKRRSHMNPLVLELAKLDLNIFQAQFQQELKQDLGWWKNTCLAEKLPFARDRLVECYFWCTGIIQPLQHENARVTLAKVNALITTLDDIYDVYGTLEELELFTEAIRRWDVSSIDHLPNYMQLCFLALNNFVDDTAYDVMKEKDINIIPYLRKSWLDLAETYLVEAKWFYSGHKPNMEEYLNNAWISISGPVMLCHVFFRVTDSITRETVESLFKYHDLIRYSSTILRLADDLGTSLEEVSRGDVPKSIQCYMNDNNASEEEARRHVRWLIAETWKKINEEVWSADSPFCKDFIACAADMGRMAQFMYHNGDGHGIQNPQIHQQMTDILFEQWL
uniref:Limonene synthase n=1 Tax=Perilla frutescens var. hirtella TaxID=608512 RepID=Q9FV75_PERFH|nr:limonene synthase [Perilla frutescens var. hirtella]